VPIALAISNRLIHDSRMFDAAPKLGTKANPLMGFKLPEGLRWQSLGRWIDLRNAGTLPETDQVSVQEQTDPSQPQRQNAPGISGSGQHST
jgi:hypothetical protein